MHIQPLPSTTITNTFIKETIAHIRHHTTHTLQPSTPSGEDGKITQYSVVLVLIPLQPETEMPAEQEIIKFTKKEQGRIMDVELEK